MSRFSSKPSGECRRTSRLLNPANEPGASIAVALSLVTVPSLIMLAGHEEMRAGDNAGAVDVRVVVRLYTLLNHDSRVDCGSAEHRDAWYLSRVDPLPAYARCAASNESSGTSVPTALRQPTAKLPQRTRPPSVAPSRSAVQMRRHIKGTGPPRTPVVVRRCIISALCVPTSMPTGTFATEYAVLL